MNPETTMPQPVPMVKEATVKDDGRLLFYYTFPAEKAVPQPSETRGTPRMEAADV